MGVAFRFGRDPREAWPATIVARPRCPLCRHDRLIASAIRAVLAARIALRTRRDTVEADFRKRSGGQGSHTGTPVGPRAVFVMLVMHRSSHEARAALIPRRPDAVATGSTAS